MLAPAPAGLRRSSSRRVEWEFDECLRRKSPTSCASAAPTSRSLIRLGVDPYPRTFDRTDTIDALVEAHGSKGGEQLDAEAVTTRTAGRVLAIRALRQGELSRHLRRPLADPGLHPAGLAAGARLRDLQAARFRRLHRRRGAALPHQDQRADDQGVEPRVPGQVLHPAAREVARAERRRDALPPALPRSDRQSGLAAGVRGPQPRPRVDPRRFSTRAAISRSRRR